MHSRLSGCRSRVAEQSNWCAGALPLKVGGVAHGDVGRGIIRHSLSSPDRFDYSRSPKMNRMDALMLYVDQSPRAYEVRSNSLRLGFDFAPGDRWRHWLDVRDNDVWPRLLSSLEASPDEAHPPSPAFQDLRLERLDSETAEFQVFGQSGQRVFSAAVRFDGLREAIDFDVCCRLPRQLIAAPLVSSYRLSTASTFDPVSEQPERAVLRLPPYPIEIGFPSLPNQTPVAWRITNDTAGAVLQLGCFDVATVPAAKSLVTIRWRYGIRIQGHSSVTSQPTAR